MEVGAQTILNWVDNSKKIFAQCYISDSINPGAIDNLEASEEAPRLPTDIDIQTDLIKKNKRAKKRLINGMKIELRTLKVYWN